MKTLIFVTLLCTALLFTSCSALSNPSGDSSTVVIQIPEQSSAQVPQDAAPTYAVVTTQAVDLTDLNDWVTIQDHAAEGIVTKKEGEIKNYVFFIDPSIAKVTIRSPKSKVAESMVDLLMDQDPKADCGFAGPLYFLNQDEKTIGYPYPTKTDLVTDFGTDVSENIRTLYISENRVWISKDHSETMMASAQFAVSGPVASSFDPSLYGQWEIIAVKGNELIILTTDKTLPENIALLTKYGVSPDEMFVTVFPPQAGCYAMDWWQWINPVGSAIFVTDPN